MDRAARNFFALVAVAVTLAAYGVCGLVAYGVLPLLEGRTEDAGLELLAVLGLGSLLIASTVRGVRSLWREGAAERALSHQIAARALPQPPALCLAVDETGLSGRVTLVDSQERCSFVYGAPAPRVALSSGLLSSLSADELRAALAHEHYHVQSLDPLRSALADAVADAVFFLPAVRILRKRYEAARELAADRRAVERVGSRPLAGALLKAMEGGAGERPATISPAAPRLIDSRLSQLETGFEPRPTTIDLGNLTTTALGVSAFLVLLAAVPLAAGGSAELAREIGPTSLLQGVVFCLLPGIAATAIGYRRLSVRSARLER